METTKKRSRKPSWYPRAMQICKNGRWLKWADEHWYETIGYPVPVATNEYQARKIKKLMRKHYVYEMKCKVLNPDLL